MRWLVLLGAAGAAAFVVWYLATGRTEESPRSRTLAGFGWAVLCVALLAAAVYAVHWLGIFSLPLVALALVPFGIATRWLLLATRGSRGFQEWEPKAAGNRPWARLVLPTLLVTVVAIAVLGVVVGMLVGRH